jgi:hypothetical protein
VKRFADDPALTILFDENEQVVGEEVFRTEPLPKPKKKRRMRVAGPGDEEARREKARLDAETSEVL